MNRSEALVTAGLVLAGAVCALLLAVFPFDYGPVESVLFAALLVGVGLFQTVLDDAVT